MKRVVVTGGAGFIGSNLVVELAKRKEVIIIDNLSTGRIENIQNLINRENIKFIEGSITDLQLLNETFEGVDYIFHQAAIPSVQRSVENPWATNEVNIKGTLNVLIAARDCDVKKVIYASSSSVYGDTQKLPKSEYTKLYPISPYAVSKLTGEYYCKVFSEIYGINTVCLRYFNVYGPMQDPLSEYAAVIPRFIINILNNESPVIFGDGKQTRDFTFIKDVVKANLLAMKKGKGVFNIAYEKQISINELVVLISEIARSKIKPIYRDQRAGAIKDSIADISLARENLGYDPEYNLEKGLEVTIRWFSNLKIN